MKKVFYGKMFEARGYNSGPTKYFVRRGMNCSQYAKMFAGFGGRVKVTIEEIGDKEYLREVYGDPR